MARPAVEKVDPYTVAPGTVIRTPNNGPDEVVRAVSVVFHMANGQDLVYGDDDDALVLVEQPQPRLGKEGRRTELVQGPAAIEHELPEEAGQAKPATAPDSGVSSRAPGKPVGKE